MVIGHVLMGVESVCKQHVYDELSKVSEIIEIHPLFGEYDYLVKVKTDTNESIGAIVVNKIRPIDGVIGTKTLTGPPD